MGLTLLDESIQTLVRKLGYIYRPAIMPPSQKEQLLLQQSGVTETVIDLGDRHHYINLVQKYGSAEATDLQHVEL